MTDDLNILLIDDNPDDREVIVRSLAGRASDRFTVTEVDSGAAAFDSLRTKTFDAILLDFSMPGSDGLDVLRELRLRYPDLAVVMMTGEVKPQIAVDALKGGAQDYLLKPEICGETLESAIADALERKRQETDIIRRANYDELTGLANRRMFDDRLDHALARSSQTAALAVIFIDLDGFKAVNDTHGHDAGDAILRQVAARLTESLRTGDTVARLGGDEFVILVENLPPDEDRVAGLIVDRLSRHIRDEAYKFDEHIIEIGLSVGMSLYPLMANNRSELLRMADEAMYKMKRGNEPDENSETDVAAAAAVG